jgi:hypothetical protein
VQYKDKADARAQLEVRAWVACFKWFFEDLSSMALARKRHELA